MKANHKARILVVDDELPVCKSISYALEREDYDVDRVLSGEEALQRLRSHSYEVMIVDLMMPGLSGMDVLTAARKTDAEISIIMMTAYPSTRTAVQSVKEGAFDYLPKPFTPQELQAAVARALKGRQPAANPGDSEGLPPGATRDRTPHETS